MLGVSLQTSYRLRGAGYRTYSSLSAPKGKSKRWLRHWLLAHSEGLSPVPLTLWLTLPEGGALEPYRLGKVRDFAITKLSPRDFDPERIDKVRLSFDGDDDLFKALLSEWMKEHLEYIKWYANISKDYSYPLDYILESPSMCWDPARNAYERNLYVKYGLLFLCWEMYREEPPMDLEWYSL